MSKYPSDLADQFKVRLPDGLRDEIKAAAKANGRSMNAEIVARLQGGGETLRDKFAGQALAAIAADGEWNLFSDVAQINLARTAYEIADAMIAARERR